VLLSQLFPSKDFHNYLMEQLLTVTNKIMTSLQKQDQSVKELSSKMDKNFDGWTQKLGMISHKKSLITIFGHKHKIKNFIKKFGIFH